MICLDYRSGQPLYRQIKDGYKRLILSGVIGEGERLPSVRELASQLAINPNTIQRAYRELEADGYVGSSPGKGVYATGGGDLKERGALEIYARIITEIQKLLELGLEKETILKQIREKLDSQTPTIDA